MSNFEIQGGLASFPTPVDAVSLTAYRFQLIILHALRRADDA